MGLCKTRRLKPAATIIPTIRKEAIKKEATNEKEGLGKTGL
jgi:hypothetical protein